MLRTPSGLSLQPDASSLTLRISNGCLGFEHKDAYQLIDTLKRQRRPEPYYPYPNLKLDTCCVRLKAQTGRGAKHSFLSRIMTKLKIWRRKVIMSKEFRLKILIFGKIKNIMLIRSETIFRYKI